MFMRVSARLQAKAAPAAPDPMIKISTGSSDIERHRSPRRLAHAARGGAGRDRRDRQHEDAADECRGERNAAQDHGAMITFPASASACRRAKRSGTASSPIVSVTKPSGARAPLAKASIVSVKSSRP